MTHSVKGQYSERYWDAEYVNPTKGSQSHFPVDAKHCLGAGRTFLFPASFTHQHKCSVVQCGDTRLTGVLRGVGGARRRGGLSLICVALSSSFQSTALCMPKGNVVTLGRTLGTERRRHV